MTEENKQIARCEIVKENLMCRRKKKMEQTKRIR